MYYFARWFVRKLFVTHKIVVFIVFFISFIVICEYGNYFGNIYFKSIKGNFKFVTKSIGEIQLHKDIVNTFYNKRQAWRTSNLGSILFKNIDSSVYRQSLNENKTFTILIWKHWDILKPRHLYNFGSSRKDVSLEECSVKNCIFPKGDHHLKTADAVVIHLQRGQVPETRERNPHQRWIFLSDESPKNTFSLSKRKVMLQELANVFNWSMTYRSDSDVPVPYGRTLPLSEALEITRNSITNLIPDWSKKRHDVLATVLMSNCHVSRRMTYLKELKKHLQIDVHGGCSENHKNSCPGHFRSDCPVISEYLFYLVLENSFCQEYLTEKAFYHAYYKGAIPVILGPSLEDCERLLPPNSYLHVDNYATAKDLAVEIVNLSKDISSLLRYHEWRRYFQVVNEHGYFKSKSKHYCRICEALNYNDQNIKSYDEDMLRIFLDPSLLCR